MKCLFFFFFSSRRRHTRFDCDWSSDVCSSDLADKAKAIPGVRKVVEVPSGMAVIADGFWPAKLGRDALQLEWDEGPMADFSSKSQREQYAALARQPGLPARKD